MSEETERIIEQANEQAARAVELKRKIDEERAEQAERSKKRMGLGDTVTNTGFKADMTHKDKRAVFIVNDEE